MRPVVTVALVLGGTLLIGVDDSVSSFSEPCPPPFRLKCDTDGDGRSNILAWYFEPHKGPDPDPLFNHSNQHIEWEVGQNANAAKGAPIPTRAWKVGATADFNGDGTCDFFWENIDPTAWAKRVAVTLDGLREPNDLDVLARERPSGNWVVVGSGTFTAGDQDDVLWWDKTSGDLMVWGSAGGHFDTEPHFLAGNPDTQWEPVVVADLINSADCCIAWSDIIWRHRTSGQLVYWQMEGLDHVASGFLSPDAASDPGWLIVGAGDFNTDGKDDLLFRNERSERLVIWYMNGTARSDGLFLTPSQLELDPRQTCPAPEVCPTGTWTIVGPR